MKAKRAEMMTLLYFAILHIDISFPDIATKKALILQIDHEAMKWTRGQRICVVELPWLIFRVASELRNPQIDRCNGAVSRAMRWLKSVDDREWDDSLDILYKYLGIVTM